MATAELPKLTARLGATQSSDGTVDLPVSLHRLLTVVWTQHPDTIEISDSGVNNTRGHYTTSMLFTQTGVWQRTVYTPAPLHIIQSMLFVHSFIQAVLQPQTVSLS